MSPKRVAIIGADSPSYEWYCPNWMGMMQGLSDMGIEFGFFSCRPVLNPEAIVNFKPDLVIYGLMDLVRDQHTRMYLRRALPDARIVLWYGDLRQEQPKADLSEIDAMFVSNDAQETFYKVCWNVPEVHYLPLGSMLYNSKINPRFVDLDFIFVGALSTDPRFGWRAEYMQKFIDVGMKVINASADRTPKLRAKIMKDLPDVYRSAKIALDVSHYVDIQGYTSNRFFVITGSGGFALTKRFPGCEKLYPEGTRAYFDTHEEALALRDYYLTHEEEREKVRAAGHNHAKNHTYDKRFEVMFDIIYGKKSKNRLQRGRLPAS